MVRPARRARARFHTTQPPIFTACGHPLAAYLKSVETWLWWQWQYGDGGVVGAEMVGAYVVVATVAAVW